MGSALRSSDEKGGGGQHIISQLYSIAVHSYTSVVIVEKVLGRVYVFLPQDYS